MQHQHSTAAGRPCLTQFFYGFRRHGRHVRQFLGYILSPFRPSLPLRFPVREGCLCSISSTRQQHQQQPSTSTPCRISTAQQQEGDVWHSFSTVLDDTLGTFWARFWRCSVLQGHCVSLSGRVRFELREEEQQQQQEQQEGSMSHCTNNSTKTGRKLLFFSGFRRHVRQFLGSILAPFRPSGPLCFPVRQGAFSASGGRAAAATGTAGGFYVSYVSLYKQ